MEDKIKNLKAELFDIQIQISTLRQEMNDKLKKLNELLKAERDQ